MEKSKPVRDQKNACQSASLVARTCPARALSLKFSRIWTQPKAGDSFERKRLMRMTHRFLGR
jgi:hypothetical protein